MMKYGKSLPSALNKHSPIGFEVLTAVTMKTIFWDVNPCGPIEVYGTMRKTAIRKTNEKMD
jgi:hypothetical protein